MTAPYDELVKEAPVISLISPGPILSLVTQLIILIIPQAFIFEYIHIQPW
jgi:hypothetical protein